METRICCDCPNIFTSDLKETYQLCPRCGAATYRKEDFHPKGHTQLTEHYFKCPFGVECFELGHYDAKCEQELFRPKCLIPIQTDIAALRLKVQKVEDHLCK